jgi:hypothetical protein
VSAVLASGGLVSCALPVVRAGAQQAGLDKQLDPGRAIDERTRAQHAAMHELLGQALACFKCLRRLGGASDIANTVKRYARAATAEQLQRPPRYGRTLVDPPPRAPAPPAGHRAGCAAP